MGIFRKTRIFTAALIFGAGLACVGSLITPVVTSALSGSEFRAGRIIDDAIFYNPNAMTVGQIQDFLNAKMPSCDNWGTEPYGGTTRRAYSESKGITFPLTCLKDYHENPTTRENNLGGKGIPGGAKSAAQILYDAGKQYNISPQVLIVMLQKEQNLVLDEWPWPNQFDKAMGYACPDSAPCNTEYFGFYNQVSNAAKQMRRYATNPGSFNHVAGLNNNIRYSPNAACGSSSVYIENTATASLYNYTPYQPNQAALNNIYSVSGDGCSAYGNRNFWRYFNDWFGTTLVGQYPSPLYKASNNDTIYVVAEGKKYPIPSYYTMVNYGLQKYPVAIVDSSYLDSYTTQTALTNLGKKANDPSGTIYLFDDGKRYPVSIGDCSKYPDGSSVPNTTWGLDCFNSNVSLSLPNILVDRYSAQDIGLPKVILFDNAAWKIENAKKRRIISPIFVDVLGGWSNVRWMKDANAGQPVGKLLVPDGAVVKFSNDALYLNQNSTLRLIQSVDQYNSWNLFKLPLYNLPTEYNAHDPLPTGNVMQYCARTGGGENFLISLGRSKVSLQGQESNWNTADCSTSLDQTLLIIPSSGNTGLYRSQSGAIFTVFDKKRYLFPTMDDFFRLGLHAEHIINVSSGIENSLGYGGMHMASGRLFKVTGDPTIRLTQGSTSLIVNSTNYPGLPYDKLITVDAATSARYPVSGTYQP